MQHAQNLQRVYSLAPPGLILLVNLIVLVHLALSAHLRWSHRFDGVQVRTAGRSFHHRPPKFWRSLHCGGMQCHLIKQCLVSGCGELGARIKCNKRYGTFSWVQTTSSALYSVDLLPRKDKIPYFFASICFERKVQNGIANTGRTLSHHVTPETSHGRKQRTLSRPRRTNCCVAWRH